MPGRLEIAVNPDSGFLSLFARTKARASLETNFKTGCHTEKSEGTTEKYKHALSINVPNLRTDTQEPRS